MGSTSLNIKINLFVNRTSSTNIYCKDFDKFLFVCHPPHRKIRGILLYRYPSVCLPQTQRENTFLLLLHSFSYKTDVWYEGTSRRYTSGSAKVMVICQGRGQILTSHFSENGRFRWQ